MDLAIGIDVGFSLSRRSTGVVVLDRTTNTIADGSAPIVATAEDAVRFVDSELTRLKPDTVTACVDGSFAAATPGTRVRLVERLFMCGPFASAPAKSPKLRLSPAPTPVGSQFLAATLTIVSALRSRGVATMSVSASGVTGNVVEIFPTLFMAALLPPRAYTGTRSSHSDDLWLRLIGQGPTRGQLHPALRRFAHLVARIEGAARRDRHDARTAAISAIAADWFVAGPPGSCRDATMFIGHPTELGFVLPPRAVCDPSFLTMLSAHWHERAGSLSGLLWL